ncbi:transposase family protein [uncultured Faecalibaculum sp.]|uniref:integrase catalytic domain-containing protein n=1 Tax=uncultured Faecalibaculum sp. TaxID=1729681 RepID=UPI002603D1F3|nr:transposase family protein [uncultured Faecalibaculum sp.]
MEDNLLTLKAGQLLKLADGTLLRIIHIQKNECVCVDVKSSKLQFAVIDYAQTTKKAYLAEIELQEKNDHVVEESQLTKTQLEKYFRNKRIIQEVTEQYGPDFLGLSEVTPKSFYLNIEEKYGLKRKGLDSLISKYLKSGCDEISLVPVTSRKSSVKVEYDASKNNGSGLVLKDEDLSCIEEGIRMYKNNPSLSIPKAYDLMLALYYIDTETGNLPLEYPSFEQFKRRLYATTTKKERDISKTSAAKVRNNKRVLNSGSSSNVEGPGDLVEVDAVELPIYLVSEANPQEIVGQPVLYTMIDVYSRIVMAISLSFDNNSEIALSSLFLNLSENKLDFCEKYGLFMEQNDFWPSEVLPVRIRFDRGADMKSKFILDVCTRLNISRELVSGASGSLKGVIEGFNNELQLSIKGGLYKCGWITDRYEDKPKQTACLTLHDLTKLLIPIILRHNSNTLENYRLPREAVKAGIKARPIELWNYGVNKYGSPRPIMNKAQYCYDLLKKAQGAYIDRQGIHFEKLRYSILDDQKLLNLAYKTQRKREPVECRYDPRSVNCLYMVEDNQIVKLPLSELPGNSDYADLSLREWKTIQKELKNRKSAEKHNDINRNAAAIGIGKMITDNKKRTAANKVKINTDAIRDSNNKAKLENQKVTSIASKINESISSEVLNPNQTGKSESMSINSNSKECEPDTTNTKEQELLNAGILSDDELDELMDSLS